MPRSVARLAVAPVVAVAPSIGCSSPGGDPDPEAGSTLSITDLYEPANDPDDHYDLAVGFAVGWFDPESSLIGSTTTWVVRTATHRPSGTSPTSSACQPLRWAWTQTVADKWSFFDPPMTGRSRSCRSVHSPP